MLNYTNISPNVKPLFVALKLILYSYNTFYFEWVTRFSLEILRFCALFIEERLGVGTLAWQVKVPACDADISYGHQFEFQLFYFLIQFAANTLEREDCPNVWAPALGWEKAPSFWLQSGPAIVTTANWEVNHWMEDLSFLLFLWLCLSNKLNKFIF